MRNGIPVPSLIVESSVAVLILVLSGLMIRRYLERRRISTLFLVLSTLSYGFGVLSSVIGKYIDYFATVPMQDTNYSGFTINVAYCLVALGNIFLYNFIEKIYLADEESRITIVTVANGIIIGLILGNNSFEDDVYSSIFGYLIVLVILAISIYILLFSLSMKEVQQATDRVARTGFFFIGLFGLLLLAMFLLFITDLVMIQINDTSYNLPYYLGWISGGLACVSAYLGYINPSWLQRLFGGNIE